MVWIDAQRSALAVVQPNHGAIWIFAVHQKIGVTLCGEVTFLAYRESRRWAFVRFRSSLNATLPDPTTVFVYPIAQPKSRLGFADVLAHPLNKPLSKTDVVVMGA